MKLTRLHDDKPGLRLPMDSGYVLAHCDGCPTTCYSILSISVAHADDRSITYLVGEPIDPDGWVLMPDGRFFCSFECEAGLSTKGRNRKGRGEVAPPPGGLVESLSQLVRARLTDCGIPELTLNLGIVTSKKPSTTWVAEKLTLHPIPAAKPRLTPEQEKQEREKMEEDRRWWRIQQPGGHVIQTHQDLLDALQKLVEQQQILHIPSTLPSGPMPVVPAGPSPSPIPGYTRDDLTWTWPAPTTSDSTWVSATPELNLSASGGTFPEPTTETNQS